MMAWYHCRSGGNGKKLQILCTITNCAFNDNGSSNGFFRTALHMNFLGPVHDRILLVIMDARSKWPKIISFSTMPSSRVLINTLRDIFVRFGLPLEIVTGNHAQFPFQEFKQFCNCLNY